MSQIQMGAVESRFADIIWDNQPISTTDLVKLSEQALKWKKTTTYTVLKRLCDKGIFQNEKGVVTPLLSREEYYCVQSRKFVDETFDGSLPAFLAAFSSGKRLSEKEIAALRGMIDAYGEE